MAKRFITADEIKKINELNNSVKGTPEYNKYYMYKEFKYKKNDKWTCWNFSGFVNHIPRRTFTVKKVKDKVYLVVDVYMELGDDTMERYAVPNTLREVLGL